MSILRPALVSKVRVASGNPSTTACPDTTLHAAINDAIIQIRDLFPHLVSETRAQFDTIAGTSNYTLPSDCLGVLWIRDADNNARIRKMGQDELATVGASLTTGTPTRYFRWGNAIQLFPTPDAAVTLELYYKALPALLDDDADALSLDDSWIPGVVRLARAILFDVYLPDTARARDSYLMWQAWVNDKPLVVETESLDGDSSLIPATLERANPAPVGFDVAD